ncbi:MAG: hypothetical protein ACRDRX_17220 [Pseudonocardiaceae bacterium]
MSPVLAQHADGSARPAWFDGAIAQVLACAGTLTSAQDARELDQLVAEMLGEELFAVLQDGWGLWWGWWFGELVDATMERIEEVPGPEREAAVWLLHGLAAQVGNMADAMLREAREQAGEPVPDWLSGVGQVSATGRITRLRDTFGTRFGVIAEFTYPGSTDRHCYLFDVDASGFVVLAGAGVHDDMGQAAEVWRARTGEPDAEAVVVEDPAELACLVHLSTGNEIMVRGDESREIMNNWFRVHTLIGALARKLEARGTPLPAACSLYHDLDITMMVDPFNAWYLQTHEAKPDPDALDALAAEWMEGALPETWFSASPERIRFQRVLISDWVPDNPVTLAVIALLPEWVRWLGDRAGLAPYRMRQLLEATAVDLASIR